MPSATLKTVTVDTRVLDAKLRSLQSSEIPFARMLALNELGTDTIRIEKLEMQDVFDRPKPFVLGGLRMLKRAKKKETPQFSLIGFTDLTGRYGNRTENIVRVHIEGMDRGTIAAERGLRASGVIGAREFLVRARRAPTDRYGNVPRRVWNRALSSLSRSRSEGNERWFVNRAGRVRGIFRVRGKKSPELIWLIVSDRPSYRKRFDFYGEAQRHADKFGGYFARRAIDKALKSAR